MKRRLAAHIDLAYQTTDIIEASTVLTRAALAQLHGVWPIPSRHSRAPVVGSTREQHRANDHAILPNTRQLGQRVSPRRGKSIHLDFPSPKSSFLVFFLGIITEIISCARNVKRAVHYTKGFLI